MWPGFDSGQEPLLRLLLVHALLRGFSPGSPVFLSPRKPTLLIPIQPAPAKADVAFSLNRG